MTRKPRSYEVYIGHKEKFSEIKRDDKGKVLIKTLTGQYVEPDSVFSQTTYKRESGKDKILNLTPDIAVGNYLLELARNFDGVWAIDTNTKIIEGESISVSAIMEAYFNETDVATKVNLRFRQNGFFLFKNCPANLEEKIAWIKMIRIISSLSSYNNNKRIAIITDHDLVKHTSINNHDEPILQSIYLPENFILIYASTDAVKRTY